MERLKAKIIFEKILSSSDTAGRGRIIVPKSVAESQFPAINDQNGIDIPVFDVFGQQYTLVQGYNTPGSNVFMNLALRM
jgi:hypothetical protein